MTSALVFILFAIASGNSPEMTALADYPSQPACIAAAKQVRAALNTGGNGRLVACVSSDALNQLANKSAPVN
jgi:hypothetical protein